MTDSEHFFIHPWLNPDESWAGFHVDYIGTSTSFSDALARLTEHPALQALDHRLLWFIPVITPECIANAAAFPDKHVVFLLTAGQEGMEQEIRSSGAKIGVTLTPSDPLPATGAWDYLVMNANHARSLPPYSLAGLATRTAVALTGLRSRTDFSWATANNCSLVTTDYLVNRSTPCNKPDMMRVRLLKLLALVSQDGETREIEEVFRQEPKLAYGLLRLVNSAAMGVRHPITSFAQAIAILGRQQLQRWLQLLVYADPNDGQHPNPLLLLAAIRGRLMEILAGKVRNRSETDMASDGAFMIGTFSLLDVLLNLSMPEILAQLPLPAPAHAALEQHSGPLGKLLTALSAADLRDFETASRQLNELGIDGDTFLMAQLTALEWASSIRTATA